jgi:hypothetical protein
MSGRLAINSISPDAAWLSINPTVTHNRLNLTFALFARIAYTIRHKANTREVAFIVAFAQKSPKTNAIHET